MHRTIVAAVALLGVTAAMAGAAPAPDSAAGGAEKSTAGAPATSATATTAKSAGATAAAKPAATPGAAMKTKAGQDVVVLETSVGDIVIKLAEADAPKTCANFRKLVASKFYDGTYFHRVIPGFMIQGGDPNSKNPDPSDDGIGGPGYTVPAEIKLKHLRGSVATARQGDQVNPKKESSGSQFFIDLAPQPSLDAGGYTVFGEVISGMDAVDKIAALANEPGVAQAAGGGANPQKKALVKRAFLAPASKYATPAASPTGAAPAKAPAKPDTTKK